MNLYGMLTIHAVLSVTCIKCGKRHEFDAKLSANLLSRIIEIRPGHVIKALDEAGFVYRPFGWMHKEPCFEEYKKGMKGE
jgi:hypothetical protein